MASAASASFPTACARSSTPVITSSSKQRLALHAASIRLVHPVTGETVEVCAEVPEDLRGPLGRIGILGELSWPEREGAEG